MPQQGLEKALATRPLVLQQPLAKKNVERLRRLQPGALDPNELVKRVEPVYLTTVTTTGPLPGGAALVPGAGIPAALADMVAFTEATCSTSCLWPRSTDLDPEDLERRQLLVLTVSWATARRIPEQGREATAGTGRSRSSDRSR